MPQFIADFHIHSKYSMATSKKLTPEWLNYWSRVKGISVMGTGDFTHPKWLEDLKQVLEPSTQGLYKLKSEFEIQDSWVPKTDMHFMLTAEISSIYKRAGKTRKVHNILWAPSFEIAEKVQDAFKKRNFNIGSDGRPIIGCDSRDLFEMCLDISPEIALVPAHIWTPWFSALGAKSGFDSIEECYGDLSAHIFAVETGLSSDLPMNRLCSFLDSYALLSNSDSHSPEKIGRNANVFNCDISFNAIVQALRDKNKQTFIGTIDTFAQAGKYHYSGHRNCNVCCSPLEALQNYCTCPVCKKSLTRGVMDRVAQLSDRKNLEGVDLQQSVQYIISLPEYISQVFGCNETAKKVKLFYPKLIESLGNEFSIITNASISDIASVTDDFFAEGIRRIREQDIFVSEGYDGEYGEISVFTQKEIELYKKDSTYKPKVKKTTNNNRFNWSLEEYQKLIKQPQFLQAIEGKSDTQLSLF